MDTATSPAPALLKHLHGIGFSSALMLHLKDLPEAATPQEVHQLEGVGAHLAARRAAISARVVHEFAWRGEVFSK